MTVRRAWLAVGVAVVAAQAGHLLAYQLRFGAAAVQIQSSGAHVYFPGLVRATLGTTAALILSILFVIGLARWLGGRWIRPGSPPPFLRLVAVMFTVQLAWFAGQEVGEALLAVAPVDSVANLLLWGSVGQLPVAVVAAASLRWLLARFESAISEIRVALSVLPARVSPPAVAVLIAGPTDRALLLRSVAGASLAKRGPPSSMRFSSY